MYNSVNQKYGHIKSIFLDNDLIKDPTLYICNQKLYWHTWGILWEDHFNYVTLWEVTDTYLTDGTAFIHLLDLLTVGGDWGISLVVSFVFTFSIGCLFVCTLPWSFWVSIDRPNIRDRIRLITSNICRSHTSSINRRTIFSTTVWNPLFNIFISTLMSCSCFFLMIGLY